MPACGQQDAEGLSLGMTRDRIRADRLLVERGHFESRARAQGAIAAGLVRADGRVVARASDLVAPDARIEAEAPHPFVSRGGLKLVAALDAFGFAPEHLRAAIATGAEATRQNEARAHYTDLAAKGELPVEEKALKAARKK